MSECSHNIDIVNSRYCACQHGQQNGSRIIMPNKRKFLINFAQLHNFKEKHMIQNTKTCGNPPSHQGNMTH